MTGMSKAELGLEVTDLIVGLLNLVKGSGVKNQTTSIGNNTNSKSAIQTIVSAITAAYRSSGLSNYDEAMFANLFGQLNKDEQSGITKIFHEFETPERKALQLLIYLMDPVSEFETEETAAITSKDGTVTQPAKSIKRPIKKDKDVRLDFMRGLIRTMNENDADGAGAKVVADMLRTNQLVGSESAYMRFKETRDRFLATFNSYLVLYNQKLAKMSEPVPVNLFLRIINLLLAGGAENAEPIFQVRSDGWDAIWKSPLRMLGIQTKRSKKCLKNS